MRWGLRCESDGALSVAIGPTVAKIGLERGIHIKFCVARVTRRLPTCSTRRTGISPYLGTVRQHERGYLVVS
jgi:hypothetical protein